MNKLDSVLQEEKSLLLNKARLIDEIQVIDNHLAELEFAKVMCRPENDGVKLEAVILEALTNNEKLDTQQMKEIISEKTGAMPGDFMLSGPLNKLLQAGKISVNEDETFQKV